MPTSPVSTKMFPLDSYVASSPVSPKESTSRLRWWLASNRKAFTVFAELPSKGPDVYHNRWQRTKRRVTVYEGRHRSPLLLRHELKSRALACVCIWHRARC